MRRLLPGKVGSLEGVGLRDKDIVQKVEEWIGGKKFGDSEVYRLADGGGFW